MEFFLFSRYYVGDFNANVINLQCTYISRAIIFTITNNCLIYHRGINYYYYYYANVT